MSTFKKLALLCLSLLTTLAVMAGCNTGGNNSASDNSAPASEASSTEESLKDESSEDVTSSTDTESSEEDSSTDSDSSMDSSEESSSDSDSSSEESSSDSDSSSGEDSSSDSSSGEDDPYQGVVIPPIENTLTADCTVGEWQLIKPATCTEIGAMVRYCQDDETHKEVEEIPAKGHDYGNNGLCQCGQEPTLPDMPDVAPIHITSSDSGIRLSQSSTMGNEMYNRYVLSVGTIYTAETTAYTYIDNETFQTVTDYTCWIQFSVPEPGQYAVFSLGNPNHLSITRYDANAHYVNPAELHGRIMDDGNFITTVSVNEKYFNAEWLTACRIKGTQAGQTVDFAIVKIDDPAWTPTTIYTQITAQEINGQKAPEGAVGTKPAEVPYETDGIYFDETLGYYCMPDGSPIFAAITKKAPRQFGGGDVAFSDLLEKGSETNFIIHISTMPNGNPLINVYTTMLLANPYNEGYNENSYQAQVNSDGLYPVTRELYEFLKLHATRSHPATAPSEEYADNAWLAACYYYKELEVGSQEYPLEITEAGTYTIQQSGKYDYYYFTVNLNAGALSTYKISINTYSVRLYAGTPYYTNSSSVLNIQNLCFESTGNSILFYCYDTKYQQAEIELVIEEVNGSFTNPIAIEADGQTVAMQPIEIIAADATKYEVYYVYAVTQSGTLTLTTDSTASIMLGGTEVVDGTASLDVVYDAETPENNLIKICVVSTNTDVANVALTFTAA